MSQSALKTIFYFRLRWLIAFAIIFLAFVIVSYYYEPPPAADKTVEAEQSIVPLEVAENSLFVRGVICLDVDENDNPLAPKTQFGNPDFLICHLLFEGGSVEQPITIRWLQEEKLVLELTETIEPGNDVFWTRLRMPDNKKGNWSVEVISEEGKLLLKVPFTVSG